MLHFSETLQSNSIVWITSLPADELGPSTRMLEDVEALVPGGGTPVHHFTVADKEQLLDLLKSLARQASEGLRPTIHFDMHGNQSEGLVLAPSGQALAWPELVDALREINIQTGNNLVCIFAVCSGFHSAKFVELNKPTPAYLLIGPADVVTNEQLESNIRRFYTEVEVEGNLSSAFLNTLSDTMLMYNCQALFMDALAGYNNTYCKGQGAIDRINRVTPTYLEHSGKSKPNRHDRRAAKRTVAAKLKPGQNTIDHFADRFLIGRRPQFSWNDVQSLADMPNYRPGISILGRSTLDLAVAR